MTIAVLKPGMLSTLQDGGRYGFQHLGVPVSGAMDSFSHRIANILADNKTDEATLEITLRGPRLRFRTRCLIALCGADLSPTIDGAIAPEGKAVRVRAGSVLDFGDSVAGCRAYLAIQGGFDVPVGDGQPQYLCKAHASADWMVALCDGATCCRLATRNPLPTRNGTGACRLETQLRRPKWAVNQHIEKLGRSLQIRAHPGGRHWDAFRLWREMH